MEARPPAVVLRAPLAQGRWADRFDEVGLRDSGEGRGASLGPLFPHDARHAAATRTHPVAVHTPVSPERTGADALRLRFQGTLPCAAISNAGRSRHPRAIPAAPWLPWFHVCTALLRPWRAFHVFVARC